jgi:hypothetical protein
MIFIWRFQSRDGKECADSTPTGNTRLVLDGADDYATTEHW